MGFSQSIGKELTAIENATKEELEIAVNSFITTHIIENVPLAYGDLRDSIHDVDADPAFKNGDAIQKNIGSNLEYSITQHEDTLNHFSKQPFTLGFPDNAPSDWRKPGYKGSLTLSDRRYWAGYFNTPVKENFAAKFIENPLNDYGDVIIDNIHAAMRKRNG